MTHEIVQNKSRFNPSFELACCHFYLRNFYFKSAIKQTSFSSILKLICNIYVIEAKGKVSTYSTGKSTNDLLDYTSQQISANSEILSYLKCVSISNTCKSEFNPLIILKDVQLLIFIKHNSFQLSLANKSIRTINKVKHQLNEIGIMR